MFTYFDSNISSTECDVNMHVEKVWTTIDSLLIIWKSDPSNKMKCFFCELWLYQSYCMDVPYKHEQKPIEKKLDVNYMLRAVFLKIRKLHPTKQ